MPLYEYRCGGCGVRFEVLQHVGTGAEGVSCPQCHAPGVERVLSTFAPSVRNAPAQCEGPSCSTCCAGNFS